MPQLLVRLVFRGCHNSPPKIGRFCQDFMGLSARVAPECLQKGHPQGQLGVPKRYIPQSDNVQRQKLNPQATTGAAVGGKFVGFPSASQNPPLAVAPKKANDQSGQAPDSSKDASNLVPAKLMCASSGEHGHRHERDLHIEKLVHLAGDAGTTLCAPKRRKRS